MNRSPILRQKGLKEKTLIDVDQMSPWDRYDHENRIAEHGVSMEELFYRPVWWTSVCPELQELFVMRCGDVAPFEKYFRLKQDISSLSKYATPTTRTTTLPSVGVAHSVELSH